MNKLIFVKYIIIVLFGVLISDIAISFVLETLMNKRYNEQIYSTYNLSADIAILGASRASHHYIPKVFEDSLHLKTRNLGIDGKNIFTQYIVLRSIVEHSQHKPKMVILELSAIDINDTPKWNTENLNILFPYFRSESYVRDLLKDVLPTGEFYSLIISGLYRHNSNILTYSKLLLQGFSIKNDGYIPLYREWNKPIKYEEEHGLSIHPKKVEYIEKFISLCKQEDIKLIFVVSPNYKLLPNQVWVKTVKAIALGNNIPFLYHEKDSLFHSHPEWFNEPFHLNDVGAHIYSDLIANEIRQLNN